MGPQGSGEGSPGPGPHVAHPAALVRLQPALGFGSWEAAPGWAVVSVGPARLQPRERYAAVFVV